MMNEPELAPDLVARWRAGDHDAAAVLYERYQAKLLRLVSHRINQRMRVKLDPEELVQSILKSAFRVTAHQDIQFQDESGFWKWLTTVGLNKTFKKIDALKTGKRDTSRELSKENAFDDLLLSEPKPEEVVEVSDLLEQILHRLTELQRKILLGKLEGLEQGEIATRIAVSARTVRRNGPAIREAALAVLGDSAPDWLFPKDTYPSLWNSTLDEPVGDWLPGPLKASADAQKRLRELFAEPCPERETLDAIRSQAKQLAGDTGAQPDDALPQTMYAAVYLLAIATAAVRLGQQISSDSREKQRGRLKAILGEPWLDADSAAVLRDFDWRLKSGARG